MCPQLNPLTAAEFDVFQQPLFRPLNATARTLLVLVAHGRFRGKLP
jgi:hypothetical protein